MIGAGFIGLEMAENFHSRGLPDALAEPPGGGARCLVPGFDGDKGRPEVSAVAWVQLLGHDDLVVCLGL
ncbi:hypothetical protein [Pseudonocardia alni]|uniref:hypothetical protein n=1 Tax=Pseudonocardia alni TaxID=33907 RepID=UPI003409C872